MKNLLIVCCIFVLNGCIGYPDNIKPVDDFELNRYLGNWYEIARLDHSFERNMEQVTATYSMRPDGGVSVKNKGYNNKKMKWQVAEGKAYFVGSDAQGYLKVSFFGPFFGSYVVFNLDADYQYAYVAGNDYDYLWLLSRTPEISDKLRDEFTVLIGAKGYAAEDLIWVNQSAK